MRFIGGKSLLLNEIDNVISMNIREQLNVVGDLFSGSAVVSQHLKKASYKVVCNDIMYMSYVLARGSMEFNYEPEFLQLHNIEVFKYLNSITEPLFSEKAFVTNNYAPNDKCNRMYFQVDNAKKIDGIRQQIELWLSEDKITHSEYFYLMASLLSAVPYVANITGVYAAYLKHWDKRTYNSLQLQPLPIIHSNKKCLFYNTDALEVCKKECFDLVYIDPPYNKRQYGPNYHILETIAKYDEPVIHGVTGIRDYDRSDFCVMSKAEQAFREMFNSLTSKYAIVSYNNEALLSTEKMLSILQDYGKVTLYEFPYRRYKSKIPNYSLGLKEQLYYIDLR